MTDSGRPTGGGESAAERVGIAGSGAIACGVAVAAAGHGQVALWARSSGSAYRARRIVAGMCARLDGAVDPRDIRIETDLDVLADATVVVEAVAEDYEVKASVLAAVHKVTSAGTLLATTTSSLSVAVLAEASRASHRFVGLHVFNPVIKMKLVELVFPAKATARTRQRAHALCARLGKTAIEVADQPGFVVNRLLFPFLFQAVELMERTGMRPVEVDQCVTLGAGHPMGPLALLDFVGLDVAVAIGEAIDAPVPERLRTLVAEGALGRKSGRGLYSYDA